MTGNSAAGGSTALTGRRILVAEDEYMIAEDMADMLAEAGAEALGPVPSVNDALRLVSSSLETGRIDAALLDVNLRGEAVWPVVDALLSRGVPVVLASGYDASAIPRIYTHLPRCEKPVAPYALAHVLARVLTASGSTTAGNTPSDRG
ncbi:MAG: response regulator [Gammaproteobacteria bacterium]